MKKTLLAAALAAASVSAYADVSVSGHVNYLFGDLTEFNGERDFDVTGNGASQSRFRINASTEANGVTYGIREELGFGDGAGSLTVRVNHFYVRGGFGQVSLGQAWEAQDDAGEQDLSGTYVLTGSAYDAWDVGNNFNNVDGGRDERLRYDSPKLGGIAKVAVDYDKNDNLGAAVFLGQKNWRLAAGVELKSDEIDDNATGTDKDDKDEFTISGSVNLAGFVATVQYGERDEDTDNSTHADDEREYMQVILGYRKGPYSVAVDFANYEEDGGDVVDNSTQGLSFVYRPTKGVELYAGYRVAECDISGCDINSDPDEANADDSISGFLAGGRVKF